MARLAMPSEHTVARALTGQTILGDLASQYLGTAECGLLKRQPDSAVDRSCWRFRGILTTRRSVIGLTCLRLVGVVEMGVAAFAKTAFALRFLRPTRRGAARTIRRSGVTETGLANCLDGTIKALHHGDRGKAGIAVGVPLRNQAAPCRLDLDFGRVRGQAQFGEGVGDVWFQGPILFKRSASQFAE